MGDSEVIRKKLGDRELEVVGCIAWGGSQKEVADHLGISVRTVDNTVRHVKEKLGLQKATELSAWWFCTNFGISFDLSPLPRKIGALLLALILFHCELTTDWQFCRYKSTYRRAERREVSRKREDSEINEFKYEDADL